MRHEHLSYSVDTTSHATRNTPRSFIEKLLPSLLKVLADDADAVVLLVLQVLSRISLAVGEVRACES